MTIAARKVLQDAHFAIRQHNKTLQGEAFRVSWFSVIGLLRAVGHVLQKVDSKASDEMMKAVDIKWKELKANERDNEIYHQFIEPARNHFFKEYVHGVNRPFTIATIGDKYELTFNTAEFRGSYITDEEEIEFESVITSDFADGRSEIELAYEAHDWWSEYLDEIDRLAALHSNAEGS